MKKNRGKLIGILLFLLTLCYMQNTRIYAADSVETPPASLKNKNQCMTTLTFQSNTANCIIFISGKQSAKGISGTLTLYDETDQTFIKSWSISTSDISYSGSMSVSVAALHKYTLSFSGQIETEKGNSETVSASVTKENYAVPPQEVTDTPINTDIRTYNNDNTTSSDSAPESTPAATNEYAASKDTSFSGIYTTDAVLYLRTGAGQKKPPLCIMENGDLVHCYGYYTNLNGTDWLYVQYKQDDTVYTGFCSGDYLYKLNK